MESFGIAIIGFCLGWMFGIFIHKKATVAYLKDEIEGLKDVVRDDVGHTVTAYLESILKNVENNKLCTRMHRR